jgi:hypothetical protein
MKKLLKTSGLALLGLALLSGPVTTLAGSASSACKSYAESLCDKTGNDKDNSITGANITIVNKGVSYICLPSCNKGKAGTLLMLADPGSAGKQQSGTMPLLH